MKKIKYQLGWEFFPDEELQLYALQRDADKFWNKLCGTGTKAEDIPIVDRTHYASGAKQQEDPHIKLNRGAKIRSILTCPVCGVKFTKKRALQIYCSGFCTVKSRNNSYKSNNR